MTTLTLQDFARRTKDLVIHLIVLACSFFLSLTGIRKSGQPTPSLASVYEQEEKDLYVMRESSFDRKICDFKEQIRCLKADVSAISKNIEFYEGRTTQDYKKEIAYFKEKIEPISKRIKELKAEVVRLRQEKSIALARQAYRPPVAPVALDTSS